MKVTQTSTNSTDTLPRRIPGASGHQAASFGDNDGPVIPKIPGPRQPSQRLAATVTDEVRACDWNGHTPTDRTAADTAAFAAASYVRIPTARTAPVHLTREQLDREIAAAQLHEPYLIGYGGIQANAF